MKSKGDKSNLLQGSSTVFDHGLSNQRDSLNQESLKLQIDQTEGASIPQTLEQSGILDGLIGTIPSGAVEKVSMLSQ